MDQSYLSRPIRLVTFDLQRHAYRAPSAALGAVALSASHLGIASDIDVLRAADLIAEDFFTKENGQVPIRDRPDAEREQFRLKYMEIC